MVSIVWLRLNKMWKERIENNALSLRKVFHLPRRCLLMYCTNKYIRVVQYKLRLVEKYETLPNVC